MPSITISTSAANFTRIINALDRRIEREPDDGTETDAHFYKRWLKGQHIELVFRHERNQAEGAVAPDNDIADVT